MVEEISKRGEDYLRAIYEIEESKGYVKVRDIAERLGVRASSVVEMLKKLKDRGLINYKRYESISLTEKGKKYGKAIKIRHDIIVEFLQLLGVPKEIAEKDAHEIEHRLSPETIERMEKFIDRFILPID
ncbi:MAG TPA: metal-dependent transcriptional regulator [Candidatus Altiarchaeales archaeon]|nr:MAG: metal-dependent transcriptional regulator [Candidatus Altiarchaeales archaeon]HDN82999.1 metal-dependent transcriptional regulator [Candidatus Altiarchaeales archaeon]